MLDGLKLRVLLILFFCVVKIVLASWTGLFIFFLICFAGILCSSFGKHHSKYSDLVQNMVDKTGKFIVNYPFVIPLY